MAALFFGRILGRINLPHFESQVKMLFDRILLLLSLAWMGCVQQPSDLTARVLISFAFEFEISLHHNREAESNSYSDSDWECRVLIQACRGLRSTRCSSFSKKIDNIPSCKWQVLFFTDWVRHPVAAYCAFPSTALVSVLARISKTLG